MTTFKSNLHTLAGQAASRAAADAKRRFAKTLSPPPAGLDNRQGHLTRRWATVTGINLDGTVSLNLDGAAVGNVVCLASYSPTVGDPVILDFLGEDPIVMGTPGVPTNNSGVQPGTILDFGGGVMPGGYLATNGAAVSRTVYARLFAAIGTAWGAGDGSTTFNVPDIRGRGTLGAGTGAGLTTRALADLGGAETVSHVHPLSANGQAKIGWDSAGSISLERATSSFTDNVKSVSPTAVPLTSDSSAITLGVGLTGTTDGTAPSIMGPFAAVTKMIKF